MKHRCYPLRRKLAAWEYLFPPFSQVFLTWLLSCMHKVWLGGIYEWAGLPPLDVGQLQGIKKQADFRAVKYGNER